LSRILVVEDDSIIAADIAETLVRLGYEVGETADSADDAVREVQSTQPDLVLMDVQLRGATDGIDAVSRIRKLSDVPVVYLTSHTDEATLTRAKETGPHGYLVKPFNERDLRTAIEVAIRKCELERHVADRERWFSTTLEALGEAVIATDRAERITFMNAVAARVTGFLPSEAVGKPLSEILKLVGPDGAALESPVGRALRSTFTVEMPANSVLVDRAGQERVVDDSATPIIDPRGAVLGGVVVFRDVTEQKRLERRLAVAERVASVGTMAAGVAHEVNNPLAAIVGNIGYVLEELRAVAAELELEPEASSMTRITNAIDALTDAAESSERIRKIVQAMKAFVAQTGGDRRIVDLPDLIEPALKLTSKRSEATAKVTRAYGTTPFVEVDEVQLVQVFTNLLTNASDAIAPGEPEKNEIRITTYTDDKGRAVAEVRDTGCGIAPATLGRIFDPFFSTKGVGSGMGVGLSICHSFVTAAGGEITAESDNGTTFRVTLPAAKRG
jgi:PAS domain S-box-containing protein